MAVHRNRTATLLASLALIATGTSAAALGPDAPSGGPAAVVDSRPAAAAPSAARPPGAPQSPPRAASGTVPLPRLVEPGPASPRPGLAPRAAGWTWPIRPTPTVLARYAVGPHRWSPGHRGVDLTAVAGAVVRSAGSGVVAFAGRVAGRGVVSVLHPDGLRTTYQPVRASIEVGEPVGPGAPIGELEPAGSHCAPGDCLHWGLRRGEIYLDPLALVGRPAPPVLLPLIR